MKSQEGEHIRIVEVLRDILESRADPKAIRLLTRIIQNKDAASYQGIYYTISEARLLVEKALEYAAWADTLLQRPFR